MTGRSWRLGLAWVLGLAVTGVAAPANDPRSTEQKAIDAQAALRWEAAGKFYQTFIESAVGDPGLPKAQKAMYDCIVALAKEWGLEGREGDAARLYLWLAEDPLTSAEGREDYLKKAPQILGNAMNEAKAKRSFARALQLQREWVGLFPSKPSPYSAEDLETFAFEGLLQACGDKHNQMALPDVVRQFYPAGNVPAESFAKRHRNEPLGLGYVKSLADLGWSGRVIAEHQVLPPDSAVRLHATYLGHVEKAALARAEAWLAQGNVAATAEAVALAKSILVNENKLGLLKMVEAKLAKKQAGGSWEVQELKFPGPVKGKVSWMDSGAGYTTKEVVLDEGADISIMPGFMLTGGRLEVTRGARLHVKGTAAQPAVFRGVTIAQHNGGRFDAENAVFINCAFERIGGDGDRFATRWEFSNCLLYRSNFESLSMAGFGLSVVNSAWVESHLPERVVHSADAAAVYKDRWNGVANSFFFRTSMTPSTVWMTDQCNFVRCFVRGEEQFDSRSPLTVNLFVPEGDLMLMRLRTGTMVSDRGDLRYNHVRKAFEVTMPAAFWALLPLEGYELPRRKSAATATAPATGPATGPSTRPLGSRTGTRPASRPATRPATRPAS